MRVLYLALFVIIKQLIGNDAYSAHSPIITQNVTFEYFPEVEYPIDAIDSTKPFYINSSGSNVLLAAFTDDVQSSFKEITNKKPQKSISNDGRKAKARVLKQDEPKFHGHHPKQDVNTKTTNDTKTSNSFKENDTYIQTIKEEETRNDTILEDTCFKTEESVDLKECSGENVYGLLAQDITAQNSSDFDINCQELNVTDSRIDNEFEWTISTLPYESSERKYLKSEIVNFDKGLQHRTNSENITFWNNSEQDSKEIKSLDLKTKLLAVKEIFFG